MESEDFVSDQGTHDNELTLLLKRGIALAKDKDYPSARMVLEEVIHKDPENTTAWLWMSQIVDTDRERLLMLKQVLRINPGHAAAQQGIEHLHTKKRQSIPSIPVSTVKAAHAERQIMYEEQAEADTLDVLGDTAEIKITPPARDNITFTAAPAEAYSGTIRAIPAARTKIERVERERTRSNLERLLLRLKTSWKRFVIQLRLSGRRFLMFWEVFSQNRLAVMGLALLVIYALMAVAHPILLNTVWSRGVYDPVTGFDMNVMNPAKPSATHLLGTDNLGRDVLSMLLAATTPAFVLGLTAALITAVTGIISGVSAAYFRGTTDYILTRIADAFLLLPAPIFMIIVGVAFHDFGPVRLGLIFGVINGLGGAMITLKSYANTVLARPFIQVTKLSGGGPWYTIHRHMIPHMIPMAATLMMMAVISAVVADSFVSFTGIIRDHLNWGTMIYNSLEYQSLFGNIEWHVLIPPSIALSMFAASFYLISRGMHEVADPKLQSR